MPIGCTITECSSGYYNEDGLFAGGCECGSDTIANVCGSPYSLGTISQGSSSTFPSASGSYNITPTRGTNDEDWFSVTFANSATCSYSPKIVLTDIGGSGPLRFRHPTAARRRRRDPPHLVELAGELACSLGPG